MTYTFIRASGNRKTGPIPQTYRARSTCPPSCAHYGADCYGEDFFTRMQWDKVPARGIPIDALAAQIAALPPRTLWRHNVAGDLPGAGETVDAYALGRIVKANTGRRGFTYTHKHSTQAIQWARHATAWGFVVNLSADDAGHADQLSGRGLPVTCIVPSDTPKLSYTPEGRKIVVCEAQTREESTCENCGNWDAWCARADRDFIVGFRAHGSRAKRTDTLARRVIPIVKG
jgi:hypothetical protein